MFCLNRYIKYAGIPGAARAAGRFYKRKYRPVMTGAVNDAFNA